MASSIDALHKSSDKLTLGWSPEPGNVAKSYNLYVSLTNRVAGMVSLTTGISSLVSQNPGEVNKVAITVDIGDVRTALSLPATTNFTNLRLYFAVTWVNSSGTESSLASSTISEILPVAILTKYRKDDPTANRMMFGFSEEEWKWVKLMASAGGALITSESGYYAMNTVTEYTYDGTNLSTVKTYLSDSTLAGSPAKLATYEYSGGAVSKITITDSTV